MWPRKAARALLPANRKGEALIFRGYSDDEAEYRRLINRVCLAGTVAQLHLFRV